LELVRQQQEVEVRRADIDRARAQVALIESQLEDTVAMTPIDGVVLVKAAQVGEILAPGTTVLTIGELAHPWLRGYIAEQDLGRVQLGQKVQVTTDSFPGKSYAGRIAFIASEAEFTPKQIQTRQERVKLVYRIKIEIDNPNQELKLNMPADAVIRVESRAEG
jgi:HlyD family secretion protein